MKKRILIISAGVWRDDSSAGNVLSNLFLSLTDEFEFAEIYTDPRFPSNKVCTKYFHLSEEEMIRSFFKQKYFGHELSQKEILKGNEDINNSESSPVKVLKKMRFQIFITIQEFMWRLSKWKSPDLEKFILDYNPNIIFAPLHYGLYTLRLNRYVASITQKKIISYVYDDHLSFRQFSLSPIFWLNRFLVRRNIITTAKCYSLLYTMTQEQLEEYQPILKVPMKVLKKGGNFDHLPFIPEKINKPLRLIYGGNIIYKRYETLEKIVSVIREINKDEIKMQLVIYTSSPVSKQIHDLLHDGTNSFLMGKITPLQLRDKYISADIVLHIESFSRRQRFLTRLSFSTKIIDLLQSARCIVAICWDQSSPYKYFIKNNTAICIPKLAEIESKFQYLINNPDVIKQYGLNAWLYGQLNHNARKVVADFKSDLETFG